MKTITIGRESSCTICINDERISRRHALIKIHDTGKMEIVDLSTNGTYVNGIKLAKNVPFPVTRKNSVVFAHARQLDWNDVPNPMRMIKIVLLSLLGLIVMALIIIFSVKACNKVPEYNGAASSSGGEQTEVSTPSGEKNGVAPTESSPTKPSGQERDVIQPETEKSSNAQPKDTTKKGNSWYNREIQKDAQRQAAATKNPKDSATQTKKKAQPKPKEEKKKESPATRQFF